MEKEQVGYPIHTFNYHTLSQANNVAVVSAEDPHEAISLLEERVRIGESVNGFEGKEVFNMKSKNRAVEKGVIYPIYEKE